MSAAVDAPALFSSATLGVVLCSSPSLLCAAPPTTSLSCSSLYDLSLSQQTDDWLSCLLTSPQRPSVYYDEHLKFHVVVTLPPSSSSPLTRSQAATFFLRSLDQPHLTLSAALSYVRRAARRHTAPNPASSVRRSSLSALAARASQAPAPVPTHAKGDAAGMGGEPLSAGEGEAVPIASWAFDEGAGRVWVGKDPEGSWVGVWEFERDVAFLRSSIVEPELALTVHLTFRDDPKLEASIERAGRDDVAGEGEGGGSSAGEVLEEEDYMDESYDDVNLLSALSPVSSIPLHLPFSRLPAAYLPPMVPPPPTAGHTRRPSRSYSISSPLASHDTTTPLHPSLRRSILRTLPVRSALKLEMRTIPCPVGALGPGVGGRVSEHEEGLVLCVEVAGPPGGAGEGAIEAFEIERIEVNVTGGGSGPLGGGAAAVGRAQRDVDVREITGERAPEAATATGGRIRLTASDQHNFLYALSVAPCALMPDEPLGPGAAPAEVGTVPIAVATSPNQRFTARFGAEDHAATGALGAGEAGREQKVQKARDSTWRRNLEIVVRGRPILLKSEEGRKSLTGGYSVPDSLARVREAEDGEELESPTQPFASRWNCTLDISPFACRPPPRIATFHPSTSSSSSAPAAPFRATAISSFSVPRLPHTGTFRPKSTSSDPARLVEVESVAGSKRHTMASLASLSLKSPVLNRRNSAAPTRPPLDRQGSTRALPPTPLSPPLPLPTPGATGPPRRFFSLPSSDSPSPSSSSTPLPPMTILRTDTPPPMHATVSPSSGGTPKRTSLPLPAGAEPTRRASWMSGLGIGSSSGSAKGSTASLGLMSPGATPQGARTSWDRRDSAVSLASGGTATGSGLGIGMGLMEEQEDAQSEAAAAAAAMAPEFAATPATAHEKGRVLITVSLVPLRTPKTRQRNVPPACSPQSIPPENLPPPTLPGLSAPRSPDPSPSQASQPFPPSSPHAAFAFPASSSSSSSDPATPSLPSATDRDPAVQALADQPPQIDLVAASVRMPRVGLLDVFLVQLFVVNQTPEVKRFVVGVPPEYAVGGAADGPGRRTTPSSGKAGDRAGAETREGHLGERVANLVPLENDVRIG
ncbi:hypothetical protein JCM21900_000343 [Sporobolomyces salmonicolor]